MAKLLYYNRARAKNFIRECFIWRVKVSINFPEGIKYRFSLVHNGKRILGYDNKHGEGHHKHLGEFKLPIDISSEKEAFNLLKAFIGESENMMNKSGGKK